MKTTEKHAFGKMLNGALQVYGRPCSADVVQLWWNLLEVYPLEAVAMAFTDHMRDPDAGRFPPVPPSIIGRIPGASNSLYPTADEAWNVCPKDEQTSGWMFPEMVTAYAACQWSIAEGDMFSARKCFVEVYSREIKGKTGRPAWYISDGNRDTQEQRERNRLMLMEANPERLGNAQLEHQQQKVAGLLGVTRRSDGEGGGLRRLARIFG